MGNRAEGDFWKGGGGGVSDAAEERGKQGVEKEGVGGRGWSLTLMKRHLVM